MTRDSRYLTDAALDEFMASGPTTAFRIPGVPEVQLVFLPGAEGGVALRVAWDGAAVPDLSEYEHLSASVVRAGEQAWAELLIDDPDVFRRALPVVWRIADRIQLERLSFAEAVVATLADFRELLEGASGLSSDREVGLFGELTVVDCLVSTLGGAQAVAAWRGPDGDEHDFDLGGGDLEVKSTLSEKRVHWIGSLSQLEPTPGRQLWLLSMQLTTGLGDARDDRGSCREATVTAGGRGPRSLREEALQRGMAGQVPAPPRGAASDCGPRRCCCRSMQEFPALTQRSGGGGGHAAVPAAGDRVLD